MKDYGNYQPAPTNYAPPTTPTTLVERKEITDSNLAAAEAKIQAKNDASQASASQEKTMDPTGEHHANQVGGGKDTTVATTPKVATKSVTGAFAYAQPTTAPAAAPAPPPPPREPGSTPPQQSQPSSVDAPHGQRHPSDQSNVHHVAQHAPKP